MARVTEVKKNRQPGEYPSNVKPVDSSELARATTVQTVSVAKRSGSQVGPETFQKEVATDDRQLPPLLAAQRKNQKPVAGPGSGTVTGEPAPAIPGETVGTPPAASPDAAGEPPSDIKLPRTGALDEASAMPDETGIGG